MADTDTDGQDDKGGIGLGTVAVGVGAGAAAGAGTAYAVTRNPESVTKELAAAQATLAKVSAEHKSAVATAAAKVRATKEGKELIKAEDKAKVELLNAKKAHANAEKNALTAWENKGSPEAIASGDAKVIAASKAEAKLYKTAATDLKNSQKAFEDRTKAIREYWEAQPADNVLTHLKTERDEFTKQFLEENKKLLGTKVGTPNLTSAHLAEYKKYMEDARAAGDYKAELAFLADDTNLPGYLMKLSPEKRTEVMEVLEAYHDDLHALNTSSTTSVKEAIESIVEKGSKKEAAEVAKHQALIEELATQKAAAVDAVVAAKKTELEAAESGVKAASKAVEDAVAQHAGKEVGAIRSAESAVAKLTKRAGILSGEGNFLTKAFKARPIAVVGVPVVVLGAVLAAKHFLFGGQKSSDNQWQNRVAQDRMQGPAQGQAV